ncbi:AgrD family cyclic lactone autoinducer peptide [Tepidibacter hydrothermalis]|uniref:Cyclic lactone autoinducer peptide n=1 Tax=Tepidibacter hydrothermalis TaxID=3036126 RepID=A0ABY8ECW6_9FIRM|nr:cyclic lactone autoinducer peptide [Tepidibacter hydrothermalis]WFD10776.1 cyclic lactone autoinducer peptide [Tepidibacter hydrothermalis]
MNTTSNIKSSISKYILKLAVSSAMSANSASRHGMFEEPKAPECLLKRLKKED